MAGDERPIDIFISHAHEDAPAAGALLKLLREALQLEDRAIRCTGVDGYGLRPGADTDDSLRDEIRRSRAFVGILSQRSLSSAWVLVEIGARWGANLDVTPLLAPGTDASMIKGPIAGKNALRLANRSDLHRLLDHLAETLGRPLRSHAFFVQAFEAVVSLPSSSSPDAPAVTSSLFGSPSLAVVAEALPAGKPSSPPPTGAIIRPDVDIVLKAEGPGLVVALKNHLTETQRSVRLLVTDIKRKLGQSYVESGEFYSEGPFPIYAIGRMTLFPEDEHLIAFADAGDPKYLDFPGTRITPKQLANLKLAREGEWQVSFLLELGPDRRVVQRRRFTWTPGDKPQVVVD